MKKVLVFVLVLVLALTAFAGCGQKNDKEIVVGASVAPHAEILKQCASYIESKGYTLKIVEFSDYIQPNISLEDGSLDANYFQHLPYLESFSSDHNYTDLVSVLKVHFEPLGIYKGTKGDTLANLKAGDKIAVPDDETNCARALQLLAAQKIITITNDKGLKTTVKDIDSKGLEIIPLEASAIAVQLPELAFAVINGNYAVDFGLQDKVVAQEESTSLAASTYANILVCKEKDKDSDKIKVLIDALKQDSVKDYITNTYGGLVVPFEA